MQEKFYEAKFFSDSDCDRDVDNYYLNLAIYFRRLS